MSYVDALNLMKIIPGAVSTAEMIAVSSCIRKYVTCKCDRFVVAADFGSHAGKSSIMASHTLSSMGRNDLFCLVDPLYDLTNEEAWKDTVQGSATKIPWGYCKDDNFKETVIRRVEQYSDLTHILRGMTSIQFLDFYKDFRFSYVFIDSDDHQEELVKKEVGIIKDRLLVGGIMMFHDFGNQYIQPQIAANELAKTDNFELLDIDWDTILKYCNDYKTEVGNDTWQNPNADRTKVDLIPNFVGGVVRVR